MKNQSLIAQLKNVDWVRLIPQVVAIVLAAGLFYVLHVFPEWPANLIGGWLLVVVYQYLVRFTVTAQHTRGQQLMKMQNFKAASHAFQRSLEFFEKYPDLDKWRSIILLSTAKYGYKEMALMNLGFAYGRLNEPKKAEQYYRKALEINPDNVNAKTGLNLLNAKRTNRKK
jgi:tetratricopeptide (TPR) repeat protein